MFWLTYMFSEVFRRWGKTLTITMGLAISSAIIIVIISISQALSSAQETVLNPLESVGTDIMLTRSVNTENMRDLDESTRTEFMTQNRMQIDLSKLGNPGDTFSADSFTPGTMLTFDATTTDKLDKSLVSDYAAGLILSVSHQEGTVPKVSATFETGGDTISVNTEIAPMTDAERAAIDAAREKANQEIIAKGLERRSEEARDIERAAMDAAMPERFKRMSTQITTERKTFVKDVGPISTDIKTTNFTIAGVDTSKGALGLILPNQITSGTYFNGDKQIVINKSYADKESKKVGDTITLNKVEYTVVGIVDPKLYTNTADMYLPLAELQTLSGKENRVNIVLIKSSNASSVDETSQKVSEIMTGSKVINSNDTAKQVTGSLVSATNLTNRFIGLTSLIVVIAAFIIVSLLTVSSINKRIREIGTLKAIGWSNTEVLRQIVMENVTLGVLGAVFGVLLGIAAISVLNRYGISLSANIESLNATAMNSFRFGPFGGGGGGAIAIGGASGGITSASSTANQSSVETAVNLKAAYEVSVFGLGIAVALAGAVISGFFAALKASIMRPQVALRNLE